MRKIVFKWLFNTIVVVLLCIVCFYYVIGVSDSVPPVIESLQDYVTTTITFRSYVAPEVVDLSAISQVRFGELVDKLTHSHEWIALQTIAPTCQTTGYTVYGCVCGDRYTDDIVSTVDHVWDKWTTMEEPTTDIDGKKIRNCIWCDTVEYDVIPNTNRLNNYMGRWVIPAVGVDVGLFRQYGDEGGPIVDAWDSAAFFYTSTGCTVIGDHNNQGFDAIKRVLVGDTAEIRYLDGNVDVYTCVAVVKGHNNGNYLTDADGNRLYDVYPDKLVCYTCDDNWKNITVVVFDKV